jgi:hypothetical protein
MFWTRKVDKRSTGKKAKTERLQVKAVRKSKSENLVCRSALSIFRKIVLPMPAPATEKADEGVI